jgi:hypothetical protein
MIKFYYSLQAKLCLNRYFYNDLLKDASEDHAGEISNYYKSVCKSCENKVCERRVK